MKHELNLFDNSVDSLNEALSQYNNADIKTPKTYKFAILLFSQSIELLFKYYVSTQHKLLIYKNPFSKKISLGKETTITLWDALQFIKNDGSIINSKTIKDIEWIKELRNNIEHYQFSMDIREVRLIISRLLSSLDKIYKELLNIDISKHVNVKMLKVYNNIISERRYKILKAQKIAFEIEPKDSLGVCIYCNEGDTGYMFKEIFKCFLCDRKEKTACCEACGINYPESHLNFYGSPVSFYGHLIAVLCHNCESSGGIWSVQCQ